MSTLKVDNLLNSAGNESPISVPGAAKAWVVCPAAGTILDSFNVSAVTEDGGGNEDYTVTFTTAFSSTNYAAIADCNATDNAGGQAFVDNKTTSNCIVNVRTTNGSNNPNTGFACVVFGD